MKSLVLHLSGVEWMPHLALPEERELQVKHGLSRFCKEKSLNIGEDPPWGRRTGLVRSTQKRGGQDSGGWSSWALRDSDSTLSTIRPMMTRDLTRLLDSDLIYLFFIERRGEGVTPGSLLCMEYFVVVQGVEIMVGGGAGAEVARVFKIRGKQHESKQNKVKKERKRKGNGNGKRRKKKPLWAR